MPIVALFRKRFKRDRPRPASGSPRQRRWPVIFNVSAQWIVLTAVAALVGLLFYTSVPRILNSPFETEVGVDDPRFGRYAGPLLGAEFLEGNSVEPLINGTEIFPAMLKAIRDAKKSITLESYIWAGQGLPAKPAPVPAGRPDYRRRGRLRRPKSRRGRHRRRLFGWHFEWGVGRHRLLFLMSFRMERSAMRNPPGRRGGCSLGGFLRLRLRNDIRGIMSPPNLRSNPPITGSVT
jgi:hypothetical protein